MFGTLGPADNFATYASIPQYISSDIRCLFMENSEYMSFDLTAPDRVTIRLESDVMRGNFEKKVGRKKKFYHVLMYKSTVTEYRFIRSYFGWKDYA